MFYTKKDLPYISHLYWTKLSKYMCLLESAVLSTVSIPCHPLYLCLLEHCAYPGSDWVLI